MSNPSPTFAELDKRREDLAAQVPRKRRLSRSELSRRAGISESTISKGIKQGRRPSLPVRRMIELVLDAEQKLIEAGL